MSDVQTLLINNVRDTLEKSQKSGVGYIDYEDGEGIGYCIDGRRFYISIKENTGGSKK